MRKNNIYTLIIFLAALAASVFVLSGCGTTSAAATAEAPGSESVVEDGVVREVRVATAVEGSVEEIISRVTTITAPNTVDLLPKVSGQIEYLNAEEGRRVQAGEVIARLEAEQLRLSAERARAVRDKLEYDRDLAKRQLDAAVIGREVYNDAEHALEQAERDYQQALIELDKAVITAPFAGVITARLVSRGDTVFPTTPLVTLTDLTTLEAEILIPQDQVDRVRVGNRIVFLPGGDQTRAFDGHVDRISPVVTVETGTVKVIARVNGSRGNIMPGQFVKAHVITGTIDGAVLVPRAAIAVENAMSVVYKVVDGFVRRIPVSLGYPGEEGIQVHGEIGSGDQVVVSGLSGLDDMTRVKVLPALEEDYAAMN